MNRIFVCMAFTAMMLLSCNNAEQKANITADVNKSVADEPQQKEEGKKQDNNAEKPEPKKASNNSPQANTDWDKKIIKNANVTLELKNYSAYNSNIHQQLKNYGAYIAQEEQLQTNATTENTITIKVPVDKFEDLMNSFAGDGIKVLEKKITSEDVTGEVIDIKGRIETKKQVRQQYIELLKQAKNMADILEVQNEINSITEEIESAAGRVEYLSHASTFSTIQLRYFQYTNGTTPIDEYPSFFTKLKDAFKSGGTIFTNLFIFLVNIWPLIAITLGVWFGMKKWNKNKASIKQTNVV